MDAEILMQYTDQAVTLVMGYVPKLVLAIITLIIGLWVIGRAVKMTRQHITKRGVDETLAPFLSSLLSWTLKGVLFISVASMVGVQTTSFVAVLGAAGLAIGLALQGSLSNFAGGVLILIFRPFNVGHVIEAQGHIGVVKEIQIFNTVLTNGANRRIVIPNGPLSNGSIVNYTVEGTLRVDLVIGVAYEADIDEAKRVLREVLENNPKVLSDPAPTIEVLELADSSVNLAVRPWCTSADYWDVYFATLTDSKKALDKAGISIPFPQRDVHIHNVA